MCELSSVRALAKETLTVQAVSCCNIGFLWGRAQRLESNTELICRLPELSQMTAQVDRFCLIAAACFSEAGLAWYLQSKEKDELGFYETNEEGLLSISADIASEKLSGIVDGLRVERIRRIIAESGEHSSERVEAMILSDARNLDDMGLVGILNEFTRFVSEGKGVLDALQVWRGKIDYRYWEARLRSFRFESVRRLAQQRVLAAEQFVERLRIEAEALDVEEVQTGLN